MSSTNTYLTCVSPSNHTGVYPFLGMETIARLRPGFAQSLKIILLGSLLPHRTRHLTHMVSPAGLNNQLYCQGEITSTNTYYYSSPI